jgi:hypothetical protein
MKNSSTHFLAALLFAAGLLSSHADAQTHTVTFNLENVIMTPDIANPWGLPAEPMYGSFDWTYTVGDFDNGSGVFTSIYLPYYGSNLTDLGINIDTNSIEMSYIPNVHGYGVDATLFLVTPLSPTVPSLIDTVRSTEEYENGLTTKGHFTSGSVVPEPSLIFYKTGNCPSVQFELELATPNGQVALLYAATPGSFVIPAGNPCAGTMLGLSYPVTVGAMVTANGLGEATLNTNVPAAACGNFYMQAIDVSSCTTSSIFLL